MRSKVIRNTRELSASRGPEDDSRPRGLNLSVVIPVHNEGPRLSACLSRLLASDYEGFEVIVVDDGSNDDTVEAARQFDVRLHCLSTCRGPAAARNAGAKIAEGDYLVFIDADVWVHTDTLANLAATITTQPAPDAVFGSYDTDPPAGNFISNYKNLFHHFVHQTSHEQASTFWSGCGAIKKDVFFSVGGFDPRFTRPTVEDIELGMRLRRAGYRIVLNKQLQVTHAKTFTLAGMIRSDVFDRAIPWTRLILRERSIPNDLNLSLPQRLSALLACGLLLMFAVGCVKQPLLLLVPVVSLGLVSALDRWSARDRIPTWARWLGVGVMLIAIAWPGIALGVWSLAGLLLLAGIVSLNAGFYRFFAHARDPLFALAIVPLHLLYYAYSVVVFLCVTASHLLAKVFGGSKPQEPPWGEGANAEPTELQSPLPESVQKSVREPAR